MRTDELRELLERYPALSRSEMQHLRELYLKASATDMLAIGSSPTLARKARRLESEVEYDGGLIVAALFIVSALVILTVVLA